MLNQRTINHTVSFSGVGLHTGERVNVSVKPADEDQGILFRRVDLGTDAEIPADLDHISGVNFSISLASNGFSVMTVEHLLATMAGMDLDNALVEIDGPEVPGMDGSARPFVNMFREAGVVEQAKPKQFIKVKKPIEVFLDGKFAMVLPYPGRKISYTINYDHPVLNRQHISFSMNETYFTEEIAAARTFGFLKDAENLKKLGLAKGVSLDNSVVIGEHRVLNENLRYHNEFVRHKVLDFIGDLSLVGRPVIGHLIALKSGHNMNTRLCSKINEKECSWELMEGKDIEDLCRSERESAEHALAIGA